MNIQKFTGYWNIARFTVITAAFFLFVGFSIKAHGFGGFAPNLEVEYDVRELAHDSRPEQAAQEKSERDQSTEVARDNEGNVHIYEKGNEHA